MAVSVPVSQAVETPPTVRSALLFSDVHLGWTLCTPHHRRWLAALPAAAEDAELIVLNGDVIDGHRRVQRAEESDLLAAFGDLLRRWLREGRRVVYVAGNHDPAPHPGFPVCPDRWKLDLRTHDGLRVRVLHGHRLGTAATLWHRYDAAGRRLLALENALYGRFPSLRRLYRAGPGWIVSLIAAVECALARRALANRGRRLATAFDVLVHGHVHYGPGRGRIGRTTTWRTGSWVSPGHLRSADRMLRYRGGRFERIALAGERWRPADDGR